MNKFKFSSDVLAAIAIFVFILSIIIALLTDSASDKVFLGLIEANILVISFAGIGFSLKLSKNDTVKLLGNGMTVVGFATGFICALSILANLDKQYDDTPIGTIFMVVSLVVLIISYLCLLIDYLISNNSLLNHNSNSTDNPNEDIRIIRIKEWKVLLDEGIISEEEFEEKRAQILDLKSETPNN